MNNLKKRFWNKIEIKDLFNCWNWTGSIDKYGYGRFGFNGKNYLAHRLIWMFTYGWDSIPEEMCVLHSCDNPPCVNLAHLFLGTIKDNSDDKIKKGRAHHPIGELHGMAKITEEQVNQILILLKTKSIRSISNQLDINYCIISSIKYNINWKHIRRE